MKNILLIMLFSLLALFGAYIAYTGFSLRDVSITDLDGNEIKKFRGSFIFLLILFGFTSLIGGVIFSALNLKRLLTKEGGDDQAD